MKHQIIKDLERRYAAKRYDSTKRISAEAIEIIKEALQLSPSSVNSQPWKFIVIESDCAKQRLHDTFAKMFQNNQKHVKEASHVILFAYNPYYTKEDYEKVVEAEVSSGHLAADKAAGMIEKGMMFATRNANEIGINAHWTKSQTYLALGNAIHTVARLGIDSTPMEGIDTQLIGEMFEEELDGYVCDVALVLGYHHETEDFNYGLPKARLPLKDVVTVL